LAHHVHINCVGAHTEGSREVPRELLQKSVLIVEDRPTAISEAGEIHRGAIEIKELPALDPSELRKRPSIFSSTGHAFLDLLATAHVLRHAGLLELRRT